MINEIINMFKNKKIGILGFGREGIATYNFIRKYLQDIPITIIDLVNQSNNNVVSNDHNVNFVYGDNYLENLEQYDLIMKTPGISLKDIDTNNLNITSQMEILLQLYRDKVIGVTGTKGKTTTTTLIYKILKKNGLDAILAGNMGIPVFSILDNIKDDTILVLEMSSHQLEFINVSPHIGIVLNLFEDHLDHAGSLENYYNAKMNMFKYQNSNDYMIYCQDNVNLNNIIKERNFKGQKLTIDMHNKATTYLNNDIVYYKDIEVFNSNMERKLKGLHNLENIMVAYTVSKVLNLDDRKTIQAIKEFEPVAYRLENIGVVDGVTYYVDTLATIPEATINAIKAIDDINTLIFGGMDRGISYDIFIDFLQKSNIEHFICMPTTGHRIAKYLSQDKVYLVDTLEEACSLAKKITKKNKVCLLSPAASSYNQFKNYAEKGDKFKEYIFAEKNDEKNS